MKWFLAIMLAAFSFPVHAQGFMFTGSVLPANGGTLSGQNCAIGTVTLPSGSGVQCTVNPATGCTFVKWTNTGSIYSNGSTSPTLPTYGLQSNSTAQAVLSCSSTSPPPSIPTTATACGQLASGSTCQQAFGHACVNLTWEAGSSDPVTVLRSVNAEQITLVTGAPSGGPCLDTTVQPGQTQTYTLQNPYGLSSPVTVTVPPAGAVATNVSGAIVP